MNAFVPCHSSTPKSASKLSVMVYHGIFQSIRRFRRSMSVCGAREANARVVSRALRWARWATWSATKEQPRHACSGPAVHARFEECPVDDQLASSFEKVEQARRALRSEELVVLLDGHPGHPPTFSGQRVTGAGQGFFLREELLPRRLPFLRRHDGRGVRWKISFQLFHIPLLGFCRSCCRACLPAFNSSRVPFSTRLAV